MIKKFVSKIYEKAESERMETIKFQAFIVCIAAPICITLDHYFAKPQFTIDFLNNIGLKNLAESFTELIQDRIWALAYWVFVIFLFYGLLPILVIKLILKDSLKNYGLSLKEALKDYQVYLLLVAVMLPLVVIASFTESFQLKYPFYKIQEGEGLYPRFATWEVLYLFQFFVIEFFFRGFMLHGTKKRFGFYSILVMTIPYCMIHFGKPLPETLGAIVAGVVLGMLSLKSNSVWLGIFIHFSVAISMDFCSLWQKGLLF